MTSGIACGIGIELVESLPVVVNYWSDAFYSTTFTPAEIAYCLLQDQPLVHLAAHWRAKKALKNMSRLSPRRPAHVGGEVEREWSTVPMRCGRWSEHTVTLCRELVAYHLPPGAVAGASDTVVRVSTAQMQLLAKAFLLLHGTVAAILPTTYWSAGLRLDPPTEAVDVIWQPTALALERINFD